MANSVSAATTTTTTKNMSLNLVTCTDMFDILDQEDDIEQNPNGKQIWEKIREEFNLEYQFDNIYDNMQDHDDDEFFQYVTSVDNGQEKTFEEKKVFTSLSTIKTCRTSVDKSDNKDLLPEYLSVRNPFFDQMAQKLIHMNKPIDVNILRQMTFFQHQIAHFNQLHHLWSAYLRAGIGSLKDDNDNSEEQQQQDVAKQIDRRYWCEEVKSLIEEQLNLTEEERHCACQDLVYKRLHEYLEKIRLYEYQINQTKEDLPYWTSTIEEGIQTFVQHYGINPLQIKYKHQIAVLTCEYEDQILQRQYQQQNPTAYQKQIAQDFYEAECHLETMKMEFVEYQERIRCNKPPTSYDALEIPLPPAIHTIANQDVCQRLWNRYESLLQQTKIELLAVHLAVQQAAIYQYQILLNEKLLTIEALPKPLLNLIQQRSLNMRNRLKLISDFTINHDLHTSSKTQDQRTKYNSFLSHLIVDSTITTEHYLTDRQLQLLNRGPTYVAPGQLHILFSNCNNETMDTAIRKQYAPLKRQLAILFDKYRINLHSSMNFQTDTYQVFQNLYSRPLPNDIYQRAIYEKQLIRSIQDSLEKNNLILRRTADQNNTFYLGHQHDFIHRSDQYIEDHADTYSILFNLNELNLQNVQEQLKKRYLSINTELDKLFQEKRLNSITYRKLQLKIEYLKVPYLYFLPITTANAAALPLQVQPMISAHQSMTSKLAQFLKQILRPLLLRDRLRTALIDEADFMKKLLHYINQERPLSPTTIFATIKITNFQTMASYESIIGRLGYFFLDHTASNKLDYTTLTTLNQVQWISIDTMKKLTELYLKNNIFYYNSKVYELTKSTGPTSLLLSEILSDIYLLIYDKDRFDNPKLKTEFYGRCKDQIFFTWNESPEELQLFLACLPITYSEIQIETSMGTSVQFLNARIENRGGHLYTSVYHHSSSSKYTLPYVIDHIKLNHSLWFRSALMRAVRFCSNVHDFNQEQIYLVMACLSYGYSIHFIETQLKHFYLRFNIDKLRFCPNQTIYEQQLRRPLFDLIDMQRTRSVRSQQLDDKEYIFHFSYPYDYGLYDQFHRQFQELWKKHFQHDSHLTHKDTSIVLVPKPIYSLNSLLTQQKPCHELLKASKKTTL